MGISIIGTGHYVPGEPVPNEALAKVMETNDEWIRKRTGIRQRHFVSEGEGVADMSEHAARRACEDAGITPEDIDFIVFCTMTPEYAFPGSGGLLGAKLGIARVPALDIRQQCAAIPFGLQVAEGLVATGAAKTVLLVGADAHAGLMPWTDWDVVRGERDGEVDQACYERGTRHRGIAVVFGDGAAAMVLRAAPEEGKGFLAADLHTDGNRYDGIYLPGGGFRSLPYLTHQTIEDEEYVPRMRGRDLMKTAVTELSKSIETLCARLELTKHDLDWVIAHQANDRINGALRKHMGLPEEKVPSNIARFGNTSAATIGILTDELRREGKLQEGQLVCFVALGSGLNWGSVLMRL